jgi:fructose/tagatose bisphosphate aldolase
VRKALDEKQNLVDPRKYLTQGMEAQIEVVRERIQFLGSSGKA